MEFVKGQVKDPVTEVANYHTVIEQVGLVHIHVCVFALACFHFFVGKCLAGLQCGCQS